MVATLSASAQPANHNPAHRIQWKLSLVKQLYEKGYQRDDIMEIFRFVDWLISLPETMAQRSQQQLAEYEVAMNTTCFTSIEMRGLEQGILQGEAQERQRALAAERKLLLCQINRRFGDIYKAKLKPLLDQIDEQEQLERVGEWIIDCDNGKALLQHVNTLLN